MRPDRDPYDATDRADLERGDAQREQDARDARAEKGPAPEPIRPSVRGEIATLRNARRALGRMAEGYGQAERGESGNQIRSRAVAELRCNMAGEALTSLFICLDVYMGDRDARSVLEEGHEAAA